MPLHVPTVGERVTVEDIWTYATRELTGIEASGTIVHPAGTGEENSLVITPAELTKYEMVRFDLNALTQDITIRIYEQIDDANYRLIDSAVFPTDFPTDAKGVPIELYSTSVALKITLQSSVTEGASRNIPYRYTSRGLA